MGVKRKRIERAANAIKFLVPLDTYTLGWTPKGLATLKWPKNFTPLERKLIRKIAKRAIEA